MSLLSKLESWIYNSVLAAASHSSSSVNTDAKTIGAAATAAVTPVVAKIATDVGTDLNAHKSPAGIANDVIGDAETGVKVALDAYILATVGAFPVVGEFLAPEAVNGANALLTFGEQHFLTYVSGFFGHKTAVVNAVAPVVSSQGSQNAAQLGQAQVQLAAQNSAAQLPPQTVAELIAQND